MTLVANPERSRGFAHQRSVDMTSATKIMEHRFNLQRDTGIVFMARVAGIEPRIVDKVVMAQGTGLFGMIKVLKCDWQDWRTSDH